MLIVTFAVGPHCLNIPTTLYFSIKPYNEMVANTLETTLPMHFVDVSSRPIHTIGGSGTMDDDFSNRPHWSFILLVELFKLLDCCNYLGQ